MTLRLARIVVVFAVFGALCAAGTARADDSKVTRIAILVGNNVGLPAERPLLYAEDDARRMKKVLTEVGGFADSNVHLLLGQTPLEIESSFEQISRNLPADSDGKRSVLLFYFSGHSDGVHLQAKDGQIPFVTLKEWMETSGASVRIAIVDACLSGRMLSLKAVRRVPAFDVALHGDLKTEGTAILTSTAAGEVAQESGELGAAFFTHHLVSGLYGAADADEDLRVTLREAYRYAYRCTVGDTARSVAGTQHPGYSLQLEGWGDLVLTALAGNAAILAIPAGMKGNFYLLSKPSGEVVAEVRHEGEREHKLFVAPGNYELLWRTGNRLKETNVTLQQGKTAKVTGTQFAVADRTLGATRMAGESSPRSLFGIYSLSGWLMPEMQALHSGGLVLRHGFGVLDAHLRFTYGAATVQYHEFDYEVSTTGIALAGLFRFPFYRFAALFGPVFGTTRLHQRSELYGDKTAWTYDLGVQAGLVLGIIKQMPVLVTWELNGFLLSMDGEFGLRFAPRAAVGLGYSF